MKEELLYDTLLERGEKSGNYMYVCIEPGNKDFLVDGRKYAEEYEDLSSEAPCYIDRLRINMNHYGVEMHIVTGFTTHFPLMSNDWYCYNESNNMTNKLIKYIKNNYDINPDAKADRNIKSWKDIANSILDKRMFPDYSDKCSDEKNDFMHSLDCGFCCNVEPMSNEMFQQLQEWRKVINKRVSLAIAICYETEDDFEHALYLAPQTSTRWFLAEVFMKEFIRPIYHRINTKKLLERMTSEECTSTEQISQELYDELVVPIHISYKPSVFKEPYNIITNKRHVEIRQLQKNKVYAYMDRDITEDVTLYEISSITVHEPENFDFQAFDNDSCFLDNYAYDFNLQDLSYINAPTSCLLRYSVLVKNIKTDAYDTLWFFHDCQHRKMFYEVDNEVYDNPYDQTVGMASVISDRIEQQYNTFFKRMVAILRTYFCDTVKIKEHEIDGRIWSNVINKEPITRGWDLSEWIPKGWRLPTVDEYRSLFDNGRELKWNSKKQIYELKGTTLTLKFPDDPWDKDYIFVSDKIQENHRYISRYQTVVDVYGNKEIRKAYNSGFLVCIKKTDEELAAEEMSNQWELSFIPENDEFLSKYIKDKISSIVDVRFEYCVDRYSYSYVKTSFSSNTVITGIINVLTEHGIEVKDRDSVIVKFDKTTLKNQKHTDFKRLIPILVVLVNTKNLYRGYPNSWDSTIKYFIKEFTNIIGEKLDNFVGIKNVQYKTNDSEKWKDIKFTDIATQHYIYLLYNMYLKNK